MGFVTHADQGLAHKVRFEWKRATMLMDLDRWCKENCTGDYTYQYTAPIFHFEKSIDAVAFKFQTLR